MIKPEYIRMAWQAAAGRDIKFPSVDWDEFVATFLNGIREVEVIKQTK
jgi:hypothetical protein